MKNDIEIPSYFTSLFDSLGWPVSVTIYDQSVDDEIEYSKIYVDILKYYRDSYEILNVMMDFYEDLSDTPGIVFDIERNQIGVDLLSYDEEKNVDEGGEVCITKNRAYKFTFQSGEQVTVKFWHTYASDGEMTDGGNELISILDGYGDEIDPDDVNGLEGPSQYIHSLEEPHEDEWMKDLCSFMNDEFKVQKRFYETSGHFRWLIHQNYYKLVDDEELVLDIVKQKGQELMYAPDHFKDNKKIVLTAVKNDGLALKNASSRLQNDEEVVMAAVSEKGQAIAFANERFWSDRKAMLTVVQTYGYGLFKHGSEELKEDKELVLEAVKNNKYVLKYVNQSLRNELKLESE
jgi:hypothetical protein